MGDEFKRYFPGINTEDISMRLTRNPFICQVDDVPGDMQNEFLELKHDSSAKDEFRAQDLQEFWVNMGGAYPQLSTNALKILILFSTTYLCESGFSTLLTIKPKARNRLEVE
ncbi:protein FAM200A-like [Macrobrachium rosenbergii]|uniref:protein FAM200A-like n=1 Tax=Macrobrachium rosenbergii TaxID=79674 RepID=UPI0034D5946D